MLLSGCGMISPAADSAVPAAESSAQSTDADTQQGSTADSAAETTVPVPTGCSPAALAAKQFHNDTALPLTADFFEWVDAYCGDDMLPERMDALFSAEGCTAENWQKLTGLTVKAAKSLYEKESETAENVFVLDGDGQPGITFTFAGDISFADNWHTMQYMKETGSSISDCISPFLIEQMKAADISCINNEFCFSDRGTPMKGKMYTFRADPKHVSIYHELGIDIVDVANNHAADFGIDAFCDTLDTLKNANIQYMGGGRNRAEASRPVYYIVEGKKIAFVAATRAEKNIMTPEAGENSPGVLRCYDPTAFLAVIREAKENADFVIANLHWGTEGSHALEAVQPKTARQYIDAGADLVIGAHAHCLQGIEYYRHVPIVYNLGNYWFNAYDIDTGLLGVTLNTDDTLDLVFHPATQRGSKTTYVGGQAEGSRILQCMRDYSINVQIDENGIVTEKAAG